MKDLLDDLLALGSWETAKVLWWAARQTEQLGDRFGRYPVVVWEDNRLRWNDRRYTERG